jgi:hypothetical protein
MQFRRSYLFFRIFHLRKYRKNFSYTLHWWFTIIIFGRVSFGCSHYKVSIISMFIFSNFFIIKCPLSLPKFRTDLDNNFEDFIAATVQGTISWSWQPEISRLVEDFNPENRGSIFLRNVDIGIRLQYSMVLQCRKPQFQNMDVLINFSTISQTQISWTFLLQLLSIYTRT